MPPAWAVEEEGHFSDRLLRRSLEKPRELARILARWTLRGTLANGLGGRRLELTRELAGFSDRWSVRRCRLPGRRRRCAFSDRLLRPRLKQLRKLAGILCR